MTLETYIGIEPFQVKVDGSKYLSNLVEKAVALRDLPFEKKLEAVKKLTLDAMVNAYEQMIVSERKLKELDENGKIDNPEYEEAKAQFERFEGIVFRIHPLSYALEQGAGCCRYQGAAFFVLGYEAELGDKHFIQAAPVNNRVDTVFNDVFFDDKKFQVNIFEESLDDKSLGYCAKNPDVMKQVYEKYPGFMLYSYHKTPEGLTIIGNPDKHIESLH